MNKYEVMKKISPDQNFSMCQFGTGIFLLCALIFPEFLLEIMEETIRLSHFAYALFASADHRLSYPAKPPNLHLIF